MRELTQKDSKVEVTGTEAKYYDTLMNIITLGTYPSFIKRAIKDLNLTKGESILDLGCGTGRNDCIMLKYIGEEGSIAGVEIGKEMKEKFLENCDKPNIKLIDKRIDEPLDLDRKFDLVFISFVLHGFIQEKREIIIENAKKALKSGGRFSVLDYNEFDVDNSGFFTRFAIRKIECPLAEDFINRDWKSILGKSGFSKFEEKFYFKKKVRLLTAMK
ncbi:MAG: class I SAM-dependent methyltransferase [Candidatus Aminicenantes bacterium]|nr:class I SAM-dependent methyltransferase [Candidatus Aminicenantes bacterium]